MFIGFAVAAVPFIILAGSDPQPGNKARHCDTDTLGPALDKINYGIANIEGNPRRF